MEKGHVFWYNVGNVEARLLLGLLDGMLSFECGRRDLKNRARNTTNINKSRESVAATHVA